MAELDAARARALVGVPFRAQGRDPARGLDCAGLVITACGLQPESGRRNYRLRGDHRAEFERAMAGQFRKISRHQRRPGDVMLMAVASDQLHLGVRTERGFVHADARRRQVVETPGEPQWRVIGIYRRRSRPAER